MPTGIVRWFNGNKGFGFIQPDDASKDVFVHISEVKKAGFADLTENQKIEYEITIYQNKNSASQLKLID